MMQIDSNGNRYIYIQSREPISYRSDGKNQMYVVRAGDTLEILASRFFNGFPTPARLWWLLAEYQPEPIFDPTLQLEPGLLLVIPSVTQVHHLLSEKLATTVL